MAVGAGILLSRLFGLVRQRVIAHFMGVGDANDVLSAALPIPNLLQNLLGEGVLSASFVPVYARLRAEGREEDAARLARAVFSLLAAIGAVVVLLGIVFAPALVGLIAAGFGPEKQEATVRLVRILFPGMGVLVLSAWCLGVLNAHRRYFTSYAAPIAWNVAIIAALLGFGSVADPSHAGWLVAVGSVAGSLLQLAVQVPAVLKILPKASESSKASAELKTVLLNFAPVLLGRGVVQISAWIDQAIASLVTVGAAGVLFYARNIALLPVSLFGMSISVTELTEMAGRQESEVAGAIKTRLEPAIRTISFFVIPSAVVFLALGDVVTSTILETGNFARADAVWVWAVLAGSAVGLLAGTLGRVYNSAWYALHDTRTPVIFALIRITLSAILAAISALWLPGALGFDPKWGVAGITASAGVAAWVEFLLLRGALARRIGTLPWPAGLLPRLWASALLAAGSGYAMKLAMSGGHPVARGVAVFATYGVVYFAVTNMMRIPEAATALARLKGRMGGGR
jgi:putative peptidoglycan lipid II flippase